MTGTRNATSKFADFAKESLTEAGKGRCYDHIGQI